MKDSQRAAAAVEMINARGFDYEELEPVVASFLRGQAERIRRYLRKSILQLGKDLIEAKRHVAYGDFIRWVEHEVGIPPRTAQGYMRIAQWAEGRAPEFSNLPVSILYVLSAQTTTREVVENVLGALRRGEKMTVVAVRREIRSARTSNSRKGTRTGYRPSPRLLTFEGVADSLLEVADILARRVPLSERSRIYDIMTDPNLLCDAQLGHRIHRAFQCALGSPVDCRSEAVTADHPNETAA